MKHIPWLFFALTVSALCNLAAAQDEADAPRAKLVVCASTPNVAALVRAVAGDDVELTVFCKPTQDPHFLRALPSFVKALSSAELFVVEGLDLESGWAPALIDQARNPAVRIGAAGFFEASSAIQPILTDARDRSAGDVHGRGNPHFLVDPLSGMAVAQRLAEKLGELRPARRTAYTTAAQALTQELGVLCFGEALATRLPPQKLGVLMSAGRLEAFLAEQKLSAELGGFALRFQKHRGARVLADHDAWPYLLRTLGLSTAGFLEPYPGVAPSTRHLGRLVEALRTEPARCLIHVPYFEPGAIDFVTKATGLRAVTLAHQVGALEGTGDYVAFVRHNLTAVADALDQSTSPTR